MFKTFSPSAVKSTSACQVVASVGETIITPLTMIPVPIPFVPVSVCFVWFVGEVTGFTLGAERLGELRPLVETASVPVLGALLATTGSITNWIHLILLRSIPVMEERVILKKVSVVRTLARRMEADFPVTSTISIRTVLTGALSPKVRFEMLERLPVSIAVVEGLS